MTDKAEGMVLAAFAADALALPAHWIYDTKAIDNEYGILDHIADPSSNRYHKTKQKGDFTHYGDQALLLLHYLAEHGSFHQQEFAEAWKQFASSYEGYQDQATKRTLAAMTDGKPLTDSGSDSSDLGGPARIFPLIYWYRNTPEQLLRKAQQQVELTHRGAGVTAATDFIIKTTLSVLDGRTPAEAVSQAIDHGINDLDLDMRLRQALDTVADDSRDAIKQFGQMCSTSAALPGAVHIILAYQDNLREALVQNVMAGGDSAARGLVIGTVLGAYHGSSSLDASWLREMTATEVVISSLATATS